jgi:hypothetical protein
MHVDKSGSKSRRSGLAVLLIRVSAMAVGSALTQQMVDVSVDDPRPLMAVIDQLERKFGWVVTYEDPPFVHPSDLQDQAEHNRQPADPTRPKMPIPRGGPFSFRYSMPAQAGNARVDALNTLIQDYGIATKQPGAFRLLETAGIAHVVPSRKKNVRGDFEACGSILDTPVRLPGGSRTVAALVREVTDAVGSAVGTKVGIFSMPTNLLMNTDVSLTDQQSEASARTMLLRALAATNKKLSWRLVYSPAQPQMYMLSIHLVPGGEGSR